MGEPDFIYYEKKVTYLENRLQVGRSEVQKPTKKHSERNIIKYKGKKKRSLFMEMDRTKASLAGSPTSRHARRRQN